MCAPRPIQAFWEHFQQIRDSIVGSSSMAVSTRSPPPGYYLTLTPMFRPRNDQNTDEHEKGVALRSFARILQQETEKTTNKDLYYLPIYTQFVVLSRGCVAGVYFSFLANDDVVVAIFPVVAPFRAGPPPLRMFALPKT